MAAAAELVAPHKRLGSDAYMALVSGRHVSHLIAQGKLPHVDTLAAATAGTRWVDQQWLGQLAIYGLERLGGLWLAIGVYALLSGAAVGIGSRFAEKRGASRNAVLFAGVCAIVIQATYISLRAQMFSMVAFAALLAIVRSDLDAPSKRVHLAWPILALWANVHGAVVLGSALVALRGVFDIARGRSHIARGALLVLGACAAPFATPYALEMPSYFRRYAEHVGSRPQFPVIDWLPPKDDYASFAIIALLAALIFVPWIRKRKKPPAFESIVIVVLAVAGLRAARNMVWLGLAVAAYAPLLFDRVASLRDRESRVISGLVAIAPAFLLAGFVRLAFANEASLERVYPRGALAPMRAAMAERPDAHVIASDIFADWVLWRAPELEGRVELDARLELLTPDQARDFNQFLFHGRTFATLFPDAPLALLSKKEHGATAEGLRALPGSKVIWDGDEGLLIWRR